MKRGIVTSIFVVLICASVLIQAQTSELPDPSEIFVEGVQWERIEQESTSTPADPVQIDYDEKEIHVYDSEADTWLEFPIPAEVSSVYYATMQSDGKVQVREAVIDDVSGRSRAGDIFLLDPKTGLFEQPPTVCDGQQIQSAPGEGRWTVVSLDDEGKDGFLCHSESGEQRDVLPEELTEWSVSLSPDGFWLLLISRNWEVGGDFQIFSYQIDEDQLLELGVVSRGLDNVISLCDWVSNTHGLLCTSDYYRYWPGSAYYAFDVTQADSVERVFGGWQENMFRIEDPLRYVSVYSQDFDALNTGGRVPEHIPCTLKLFDAAGLREVELGYECIPIMLDDYPRAPYYRQGNTIYYLAVDSEDSTISTLGSYDVEHETGNNNLRFGEIESILSVSPDGRYVVLVLDDNGVLDFPWDGFGCCYETGGWQIVILNPENNRIVYRSERIGVYKVNQVRWLDDSTVVIAAADELERIRDAENGQTSGIMIPPSIRRINFDNDVVRVSITTEYGIHDGELRVSPDGNYWVQYDKTVIDLRTFERVPVLRDDLPEGYAFGTDWLEDGRLRISISVPYGDSVTYAVTLP